MRKLFLVLMLGVMFAFPSFALAQNTVVLSNVSVQLWPEYDQPSMLVITDFQAAPDTELPADLTFRIPQDANLIAVAAYTADGGLMNAVFDGPKADGESQVFTIKMDVLTSYRFEYYQPISFNGNQRIFSYLWDGSYAVDEFNIRVLEPVDMTSLSTSPDLASIVQENALTYHAGEPVKLAAGEQFPLNLQYDKTTETLVLSDSSSLGIQPFAPVDENTPGRVSLNNSLPYIIGFLGLVMVVGGGVYLWRYGGSGGKKSRRRSHSHSEDENADSEAYCPQCGARAKAGDRFCRVCGARLRHQEE